MSLSNYIFFDGTSTISPESPVYRIFSIERLIELFANKKLTLVKPIKWDDPFENFILKSNAVFKNGEEVNLEFSNAVFGQCWSLNQETDAMWRIYSPLKNGVKVRSTSRKLREALARNISFPEISAFMGVVRYRKEEALLKMTEDRVLMNRKIFSPDGRGQAETLLFKRNGFKHEKEVRLIFFDNRNSYLSNDIFSFDINPHDLLDDIVFDPRMSEQLVSVYTDYFRRLGFNGDISRSTFYELPSITLRL